MTNRKPINRRSFLGQAGAVAIGAGALGGTALSYGRILGANDRISLGHVGVGRRGTELAGIVARLKAKNVEMTAVCDLWKVNREAAVGRPARTATARSRWPMTWPRPKPPARRC